MRRHLNEMTIKNLPFSIDGQVDIWDVTLPRFGLRIGKRTKTFILNAGKRRISLGRYGLVSLKHARDEARRRIGLKYLPQSSPQAPQAARAYLDAIKTTKKPSTVSVYALYLERLPDLPVHELNPQNLYSALPRGNGAANLCFSTFKAFLSWCVERAYIDANPLLKRRQPNKAVSRDRLLTDEEIRLIWQESANHNAFGSLVHSLILSGQRLSQIAQFNPSWLRDGVITFPPSIMKSNAEHSIPASDFLISHLPPHRLNRSSEKLDRFRSTLAIPHFTLHDFRRYFSSTCSRLRVPIDITETILAHKTGSRSAIQKVYDRDARIPQMRDAFTAFEAHLQRILQTNGT
jgi:integrase